MKAKEKAEKLVSDFYTINCKLIKVKNGYDMGDRYNLVMPISKQCALIAVDEIISSLGITTNHCELNKLDQQEVKNDFEYWQEVKQEIEKL
jgi:hypothetical protein